MHRLQHHSWIQQTVQQQSSSKPCLFEWVCTVICLPQVEVILRVVQPQTNSHRVSLSALCEDVIHGYAAGSAWFKLRITEPVRGFNKLGFPPLTLKSFAHLPAHYQTSLTFESRLLSAPFWWLTSFKARGGLKNDQNVKFTICCKNIQKPAEYKVAELSHISSWFHLPPLNRMGWPIGSLWKLL